MGLYVQGKLALLRFVWDASLENVSVAIRPQVPNDQWHTDLTQLVTNKAIKLNLLFLGAKVLLISVSEI